jgi:hypothetical protein
MSLLESMQRSRRRSRRQSPRHEITLEWRRNTWGFAHRVDELLDISQDGIRIATRGDLAVGDQVEIHISGVARRHVIQRAARVVWALPAEGGFVCAGLRFLRSLPLADVAAMTKLD